MAYIIHGAHGPESVSFTADEWDQLRATEKVKHVGVDVATMMFRGLRIYVQPRPLPPKPRRWWQRGVVRRVYVRWVDWCRRIGVREEVKP